MGQCGSLIADIAAIGIRNANRLVEGIPADRFARFAAPGNVTITANHPAFIFGHLCLYPANVFKLIGQEGIAQPPAHYDALFSKNATCVDDPDGSIYPTGTELKAFFDSSYATAVEAIRQVSDEQLAAPNPVDSPLQAILPTLGALIGLYLTNHVTLHLGQLSTWRRMEGLPPA
ncbi:DinB family protein [Aureliella helgolandensis]|uniref:DinB superfamily protein n=1 Tax=Aureliella helgolandensis TaxID=2527968 RepID=A0A518GFP8_9BACT|nr:DinB family protein [Aureliella helgolandensis]QDV27421.1 DinB superfamily protein [Aureliella helgolandensis]